MSLWMVSQAGCPYEWCHRLDVPMIDVPMNGVTGWMSLWMVSQAGLFQHLSDPLLSHFEQAFIVRRGCIPLTLVTPLRHICGFEWDFSKSIEWIALKCSKKKRAVNVRNLSRSIWGRIFLLERTNCNTSCLYRLYWHSKNTLRTMTTLNM